MIEALARANKYINLEEDKRQDKKDRGRENMKDISAIETAEIHDMRAQPHCVPYSLRKEGSQYYPEYQREVMRRRPDEVANPFRHYSLTISPDRMVKHLEGKDYVKWPKKIHTNPRSRDSSKWRAFHDDFGHLIGDCRQLKWEIETFIKRGHLREFM